MKNAIIICTTLFIASLLLGMASCKKQQQPTPFTAFMGSWKKVQYATDDNDNGIIDQQEIRNQPLNQLDILVLKSDSTSYYGFEAKVYPDNSKDTDAIEQWFVSGDSLYISYVGHYSVAYYVEHISSDNLTIITNASTGLAWYSFSKY